MARIAQADIEKRFYDVFSGWDKADREVAMRVLAQLHPRLPDRPRKAVQDAEPETPEAQRQLAIGDKA